jgi:hypothetical protein
MPTAIGPARAEHAKERRWPAPERIGRLERNPVALTHSLSVVMPAPGHFVPGLCRATTFFAPQSKAWVAVR